MCGARCSSDLSFYRLIEVFPKNVVSILFSEARFLRKISCYRITSGRQPRTAFGVSQDGTKAIIMVVDGRGDSIGATHQEMADLMRTYGAYDAMHLDGGGSSTMAVKTGKRARVQKGSVPEMSSFHRAHRPSLPEKK